MRAIDKSIKNGDIKTIKRILRRHPDVTTSTILIAGKAGRASVLKLLVDYGVCLDVDKLSILAVLGGIGLPDPQVILDMAYDSVMRSYFLTPGTV